MLTRATILITTFLIAIPIMPTWASTPASLSVALNPATPDVGDTFTASVMVSGASCIVGYDIAVYYDPAVFTATSISLAGTLFAGAFELRSDIIQPLGVAREAAVILGGGSATPNPSGSLLDISFKANNPTMSSTLFISSTSSMVGPSGCSGQITPIPYVATPTVYSTPSHIALRDVGCRAVNGGFNTLSKGFTDGVFCRVVNTGSQTIMASAIFSYESVGGIVANTGSVNGGTITLAPGQAGEVDGSITVANSNDIIIVNGVTTRIVGNLAISGPSDIFKIVVNVP